MIPRDLPLHQHDVATSWLPITGKILKREVDREWRFLRIKEVNELREIVRRREEKRREEKVIYEAGIEITEEEMRRERWRRYFICHISIMTVS